MVRIEDRTNDILNSTWLNLFVLIVAITIEVALYVWSIIDTPLVKEACTKTKDFIVQCVLYVWRVCLYLKSLVFGVDDNGLTD